jgi:uncharacterized membrane protein
MLSHLFQRLTVVLTAARGQAPATRSGTFRCPHEETEMTPEEAQRYPLAHERKLEPVTLQSLHWADPVRWLTAAWTDVWRTPALGLAYGLLLTLGLWASGALFLHSPTLALVLVASTFLLSPALFIGLIEASRTCALGQRPRLGLCLACWWRLRSRLAMFSIVLLAIEIVWMRFALIMVGMFFERGGQHVDLLGALLAPSNRGFLIAYLTLGALFMGLAFAVSVVAVPMLLDTQVDAITAAFRSLRACAERPVVLLIWALLLAALCGLALVPAGIGLVLAWPLIGHASWHAYRGIMRPEACVSRPGMDPSA